MTHSISLNTGVNIHLDIPADFPLPKAPKWLHLFEKTTDNYHPDVEMSVLYDGDINYISGSSIHNKDSGWVIDFPGWQLDITLGPISIAKLLLRPGVEDALSMTIQILLFLIGPFYKCLFLHSAGMVVKGKHIIIFGPSGAGKTTACILAPPNTKVMSDEHIICRKMNGCWMVHATPFSSDGYLWGFPEGNLPLDAAFFLSRGSPNMAIMPKYKAVQSIMLSSIKLGGNYSNESLHLVADLVSDVAFYHLTTNDPSQVWPLINDIL